MTLFATFVCIAILFTVGYFLFAVLGEVALWLYNRLPGSRVEDRSKVVKQSVFDH